MKDTIIKRKEYIKKCGSCDKKIKYYHGYKPDICPFCKSIYWSKPKTEVKLFELQTLYLAGRDKKILEKMYIILKDYAKSLIFKLVSWSYKYDHKVLDEKCHDSANGIILYYLQKPFFKIDNSFAGYLIKKIKEILYSSHNEDNHESLNMIIQNSNNQELMDIIGTIGYSNINSTQTTTNIENRSIDLAGDILRIISISIDEIKKEFSLSISLSVLIGVLLFVEHKSELFQTSYYGWRGYEAKKHVEKIKLILSNYLKGKK